MMPVIRISDSTFADLSALKTWLGTRTPGETIEQVVREAMDRLGMERDELADGVISHSEDGVLEFDNAPGLSFTKPLKATINGKNVKSPRWSSLLLTIIAELKSKGFEGQALVSELGIPAKNASYEEDGFKYRAELGISVQGQSANDAWREIDRIAKKWSIPVSIEFWWRQNTKAQFPGRTGRLKSGGAR